MQAVGPTQHCEILNPQPGAAPYRAPRLAQGQVLNEQFVCCRTCSILLVLWSFEISVHFQDRCLVEETILQVKCIMNYDGTCMSLAHSLLASWCSVVNFLDVLRFFVQGKHARCFGGFPLSSIQKACCRDLNSLSLCD